MEAAAAAPDELTQLLWLRLQEIAIPYAVSPDLRRSVLAPPRSRDLFETRRDTGWLCWNQGRLQADHPRPKGVRILSSSSMFWDPKKHGFTHVPFNCLKDNFPDDGLPHWSDLSFERAPYHSDQNVWKVGYRLREAQIHSPLTDPWRDLLGPAYFCDGLNNYTIENGFPTPCGLAGSIPTLIGLVAFTSEWDDLKTTLEGSFRPPDHHDGRGLYVPTYMAERREDVGKEPNRGLVIQIGFDSQQCSRPDLEFWADGGRGPILRSSPRHRKMSYSFLFQHWQQTQHHQVPVPVPIPVHMGGYPPYHFPPPGFPPPPGM